MRQRSRNLVRAAVVISSLLLGPAKATTIIPPTFEEMTDRADLVFLGLVLRSHAEWRSVGTNRVIFTLVEFKTQEVLKGDAAPTVMLQFLGGRVGDVRLEVSEVPAFETGERVLLFVEGNGVQFCPLVGVYHGKFRVGKEAASGRDVILRHDGKPLRDLAEIGAGAGPGFAPSRGTPAIPSDRGPMGLAEFTDHIRSHLAKKRIP